MTKLLRKTFITLFTLSMVLLSVSCSMLKADELPSYRISYFANGADGQLVPVDTKQYISGDTIVVQDHGELKLSGFVFDQWNSKANGLGDAFEPGDTILMESENIRLYAQWTPASPQTLSFDSQGGTTELEDQMFLPGSDLEIPTTELYKTGYSFVGWNTISDGSGVTYGPGEVHIAPESSLTLYAQWSEADPFVTRWISDNNGDSKNHQIILPLNYSGNYDFVVSWGDGSCDRITSHDDPRRLHNYDQPGSYTIKMVGQLNCFGYNEYSSPHPADQLKLVEVLAWGDLKFSPEVDEFYDCSNLDILATDQPDFSETNSLKYSFTGVKSIQSNINAWDVSGIELFTEMFKGYSDFNQPLNLWDVSSATAFDSMFSSAENFNQDIGNWNTSKVIDMSSMFCEANSFNQSLIGWDTSSVTNMSEMFSGANLFNQSLSDWNTSNVTDMSGMFRYTESFDQSLAGWDTSSVITMEGMFSDADQFDQPLVAWNTSNVTDMAGMFSSAYSFNQPLADWNTSSVTTMSSMFFEADLFDQPLASWVTSSVEYMSSMFSGADLFDQPLAPWDTSSVKDMSYMFSSADSFNQPLGGWDTSVVTDMSYMFSSADSFNQPLGGWDTSGVTDMSHMFFFAKAFNQDLSSWNITNVKDMSGIFSYSGLSTENYSKILIAWEAQNVQNGVQLGAIGITYNSTASAARQRLIDDHNWVINDDGLEP